MLWPWGAETGRGRRQDIKNQSWHHFQISWQERARTILRWLLSTGFEGRTPPPPKQELKVQQSSAERWRLSVRLFCDDWAGVCWDEVVERAECDPSPAALRRRSSGRGGWVPSGVEVMKSRTPNRSSCQEIGARYDPPSSLIGFLPFRSEKQTFGVKERRPC